MLVSLIKKSLYFFLISLSFYTGIANASEVNILVLDQKGQITKDAVVYLLSSNGDPIKISEITNQAIIDQKNEAFIPYVTAIPRTSSLKFVNSDTTSHHIYSFSKVKPLSIVMDEGNKTEELDLPKAGPIILGCNIHDHMLAFIYVVDTPYYGLSKNNGTIKITNVPAGDYQLNVWHPRLKKSKPTARPLKINDGSTEEQIFLTLRHDRRNNGKRRKDERRY